MSASLVLVRHGETAWNAEGRLQGQTDIPLNQLGRDQALVAGAALGGAEWDVLVSSTLGRAIETAELIGANLGLSLGEKFDGLRERGYGDAEGRVVKDLPREQIDELLLSAEPEDAVASRGLAVLGQILERHEGQRIIAVAHGTLIRLVLNAIAAGPKVNILRNGEVVVVDVQRLREHMASLVH